MWYKKSLLSLLADSFSNGKVIALDIVKNCTKIVVYHIAPKVYKIGSQNMIIECWSACVVCCESKQLFIALLQKYMKKSDENFGQHV